MMITLYEYHLVYDTGEWYALGHDEYHTQEEAEKVIEEQMALFKKGEFPGYEPYAVVKVMKIMAPAEMDI
jgi:hypothetical protein